MGYFLGLVFGVTVLCMNLVTAAIIEQAISAGKEDRDVIHHRIRTQADKFIPLLTDVFEQIDDSHGGKLTFRDLQHNIDMFSEMKLPSNLGRVLEPCTLKNVFELMDHDGDGTVDVTDFVRGIFSLAYTHKHSSRDDTHVGHAAASEEEYVRYRQAGRR